MKRLLIADVHANLPALQAVLDAAGAVDEIVFLGDIVVCGPHPAECVDLLRECGARAIVGNHDAAAVDRPAPGSWEHWTRERLSSDQRGWLARLPESLVIESCAEPTHLVHRASDAYLHPDMPDGLLAELVGDTLRGVVEPAVYAGHSHWLIERTLAGRRFVCLRAVGQPRDRDPRAGYAIEQDGVLEHHRVAYDVDRLVHDLTRAGFPAGPVLDRWIRFFRTAHDSEWSREYNSKDAAP